jgi:y4mF family transcriptional regulator
MSLPPAYSRSRVFSVWKALSIEIFPIWHIYLEIQQNQEHVPDQEFLWRCMTDDLAKAFGDMVRANRRKAGLTQAELALISGTGLRFIIDLEAGKASCRLGMALRVGKALGIEVTTASTNADLPGAP